MIDKDILSIECLISDLEKGIEKVDTIETPYSAEVLNIELKKLRNDLKDLKKENNNILKNLKKESLSEIINEMLNVGINGDMSIDIDNWNKLNLKIEDFERKFKEEGYYGIGNISIPNEEDNITYEYCKKTFNDVLEEVKKQYKILNRG